MYVQYKVRKRVQNKRGIEVELIFLRFLRN